VRPQELELLLLPLLVPRHPRHGINWLILNQFSASATEAAAASTGLLSSDIVRLDEVWAHALTHARTLSLFQVMQNGFFIAQQQQRWRKVASSRMLGDKFFRENGQLVLQPRGHD
jgi:hypothetical protein